jgi:hypothetical protein
MELCNNSIEYVHSSAKLFKQVKMDFILLQMLKMAENIALIL